MSKRRSKIPILLKNYKFPDKYQSIAIQTSFNLNSKQLNTTFVIDKKDENNSEIESSPIYASTPFRKRRVKEVEPHSQTEHASPASSTKSHPHSSHDHHRSQQKAEEDHDHGHDMLHHDT